MIFHAQSTITVISGRKKKKKKKKKKKGSWRGKKSSGRKA